jgi:signal transduction histidine kinase/ligand-binding sensor domain-containing protein
MCVSVRAFANCLLIFLLVCCVLGSKAQTYYFSNYSLKEGLAQSQVNVIFQAKNQLLWMGTYGGVSTFNGVNFNSLSKAEGLASGFVNCITEDEQQQILLGTDVGITRIANDKITNHKTPKGVSFLQKDKNGKIWGIAGRKIFWFEKNRFTWLNAVGLKMASYLTANHKGDIFASFYNKGIYKLDGLKWSLYLRTDTLFPKTKIWNLLFDRYNAKKIYVIANMKLFEVEGGRAKEISLGVAVITATQDATGNIWAGTGAGAYLIKPNGQRIFFSKENGLSNNPVAKIFCDNESNVWLSVFGEGIYKYEGDGFLRFETFKGKNVEVPISGLATDNKKNLFIATYTNGLYVYNNGNLNQVLQPEIKNKNIQCITKDNNGNVWFAVEGSGIWKKTEQNYQLVFKNEGIDYNGIEFGKNGMVWVTTPISCCYKQHGKGVELKGFKGYVSYLFKVDENKLLLATNNGLYAITDKKINPKSLLTNMQNVNVMHICRFGNKIMIATLGDGLMSYDLTNGKINKYTKKDGLNSNDIYSVAVDKKNELWVGTGRGVDRLYFNQKADRFEVQTNNNNTSLPESNQAAITNYNDKILVGTIKGIVVCNPYATTTTKVPYINLYKLTVHTRDADSRDSSIYLANKIKTPHFSYKQNHITINYKGVFLTNPASVRYQYKLLGLDYQFNPITVAEFAEYSALKPGKYTFQVKALANHQQSRLVALTFIIDAPFYDYWYVKLLVVALTIFIIYLCIAYYFKRKEEAKKVLERIKYQEQQKIRIQTSEDFHDDIGNKLTRINVLSEILDHKIDVEEKDKKELVKQIRESANLLYSGTKDILWALDPKSGNLYEILNHIKDFGCDLFSQTGISFNMEGIKADFQKVQLDLEYNRNFSLIFKELLNNILKHAKAKNVAIVVTNYEKNKIAILVTDDGIGFDSNKKSNGKGLNNIKTRSKRINADFELTTKPNVGTTITLSTQIIV